MITPRFRRLEQLLGARLDSLTAEHIASAVARDPSDRLRENSDLDFKQSLYARDGKGKNDLCGDVAAMANSQGGVILLGVAQNEQAEAIRLDSVELSDTEEQRMRHVVASAVAPPVEFELRALPIGEDPGRGIYALVVPASVLAPHGVNVNDAWRYYRRYGRDNRPMMEAEVADMYRRRFRAAETEVARLEEVSVAGASSVGVDSDSVWLAMAIVPSRQGYMEITAERMRETRRWASAFTGSSGDGPFYSPGSAQIGTGVGRITISSFVTDGRPQFDLAHLYQDGAGFMAHPLFHAPDQRGKVTLQGMVHLAAGMLRALADHTVTTAGASGDAVARCELLFQPGEPAIQLGYFDGPFWRAWEPSEKLTVAPKVGMHAISLDAITKSATESLAATRILVTDLVHGFGIPEVVHLTADGHINEWYWDASLLKAWKSAAGVPRINKEVRFY